MAITKPDAVTRCLNLINWDAGSWVHQSISFLGKHIFTLDIPPFSLHVGGWVDWALDALLWAINAGIDEIWVAVRAIPSIPGILEGVFQVIRDEISGVWQDFLGVLAWTAGNLWEGIRAAKQEIVGAIAWTASLLWEGINTAKREVMDWTPGFVGSAIAAAFLPFRWHFNLLTEFGQDIIDLHKYPEEWLLKRIESMLIRFW
jgi:hypothetical protein